MTTIHTLMIYFKIIILKYIRTLMKLLYFMGFLDNRTSII